MGQRTEFIAAVFVAAVLAAALGLQGCGSDEAAFTPTPTRARTALGDSYSAGEGTDSYLPGTDTPGVNVCHRSSLAYSQLLDPPAGTGTAFVACSGALTADLFGPNHNDNNGPTGSPEPAQLCQNLTQGAVEPCGEAREPALSRETTTATLTIGGNDVGFARILQSCVFVRVGRLDAGLPGRGCRDDPIVAERAARRIAALGGAGHDTSPYGSDIHSLSEVLATIHTLAPDARVFIAGYPKVFDPATDADCQVGTATLGASTTVPVWVTARDARAADSALAALNATSRLAVARAGSWASYVDPTTTFVDHGLCSGADPLINPVRATVQVQAERATRVEVDPGSGHPSVDGQHAYATCFKAAGA